MLETAGGDATTACNTANFRFRGIGNDTEPILLPEKYDNGTFAVLGDNSSLGFPTVRIDKFLRSHKRQRSQSS